MVTTAATGSASPSETADSPAGLSSFSFSSCASLTREGKVLETAEVGGVVIGSSDERRFERVEVERGCESTEESKEGVRGRDMAAECVPS